jgi:hypothetical protein
VNLNLINSFIITGPMLFIFHRAWLLEFENSIREIDPQIEALPYWNYARDLTEFDLTSSESIFSDKYLGMFSYHIFFLAVSINRIYFKVLFFSLIAFSIFSIAPLSVKSNNLFVFRKLCWTRVRLFSGER